MLVRCPVRSLPYLHYLSISNVVKYHYIHSWECGILYVTKRKRKPMTYQEFLDKHNLTDADIAAKMRELPDPVLNHSHQYITPIFSDIQGIGIATECAHTIGDPVSILLYAGIRHVGSRYINHSDTPNAQALILGSSIWAVALRDIPAGEEITMCYDNNLKVSAEYEEARKNPYKEALQSIFEELHNPASERLYSNEALHNLTRVIERHSHLIGETS